MCQTQDRVALVTGGTSGIGADIARQLASEGYRVAITGRNAERGERLAQDLGSPALFIAADLTTSGVPARIVRQTVAAFGRLDVLVNNAGIDLTSELMATSETEIRKNFELNTFAAIFMLQAAAAQMRQQRDGVIINVTSRLATIGVPTMTIYSAAKGAIQSLTTAAAVELAEYNIRVNAVAPGMTKTPLYEEWLQTQPDPEATAQAVAGDIPLRRIAGIDDVSWAVSFLAHPRSAYVTGASIPVDGGYTAQ